VVSFLRNGFTLLRPCSVACLLVTMQL